ncbi:hypothetical protein GCM10027053_52770 [Intrasporangium mesophilum]
MSTVALPRRPRVPIWLRPLTRPSGEVQFGVLPGGPIVGGASSAEVRLLSGLDGGLSLDATYERARASGVSRSRWRELLTLTTRLGVLVDADEPVRGLGPPSSLAAVAEPYAALLRVVVDGAGPVAAEIAAVVGSCAGVTAVHDRADVDGVIADPAGQRPDLVVLVGSPLVDPRRGNLWLRHCIPHLPVATAGPHTTVGPLVDGSAAAPCLWCLDQHRADRDEAWPTVLAQATPDLQRGREPRPEPPRPSAAVPPVAMAEGVHDRLPPGLGQLVAGTVALFVSRLAEGQLPPRGVSVDVSLPWPRMDHRRWGPHPLCPAHLEARQEAEWPPALGTERPAGLGRL